MIAALAILTLVILAMLAFYWFNSRAGRDRDQEIETQTIDAIESLLPQTQCGKCGYPGCRPYAQAIATGRADINQCPPGGDHTIHEIADLLGTEPKPMAEGFTPETTAMVALIDEDLCIGCVKCIKACPVDAIMGAPKLMHTVIKRYCTGCELCVPACPVDCISMVPSRVKTKEWVWSKPDPSIRSAS